MRTVSRSAFAVVVLALLSLPAFAWSGPQVSLGNKNGRKVVVICDQGGGCTQSTPFFLALNSNAPSIQANGDWSTFMYEAQLHANYVGATRNGVVPMLQVHIRAKSDAFLDNLAAHLNQLSPRPYLYIRLDLRDVDPRPGLESNRIANLQGQTYDVPTNAKPPVGRGAPWAFTETWFQFWESEIDRVLNRLDATYPGRVMGINVVYGDGGEWFFRPYGYSPSTGQLIDGGTDFCGTGGPCYPWTNDSSPTGANGRQFFFLHDYSSTTVNGFCNWSALPSSLRSGCRAATVAERNNADPNVPLGTARGVFLNPADLGSLRAAYYNCYIRLQSTEAITRCSAQSKQTTGNRILTSAFYGYQYELDAALPTSGHNALTELLASPYVDFVISPYSYRASRALGNPIEPMAPSDSPRLSNKLWIDEDDTRTHLAGAGADQFQTIGTLWDSIRILRRNILSAGLHGRGSHFFDIQTLGWFGRPDMDSDSQTLWANLHNAFTGVDKIQLNAPNRFEPQVAVFVDDLSSNYVAGLTPAHDSTYSFATDIASGVIDTLGRLGTPVKQYLLSDLRKSNLDLSNIKFAVIANAWNVPFDLRTLVEQKLKTAGRTVLYVYGTGYMQDDSPAAASNIEWLTGIHVVEGDGTPASLSQNFTVTGQTVVGGPDYGLSPWFRVDDFAAQTLGTYRFVAGVSLGRKVMSVAGGNYTAVVACAPKVPLAVLRKLSEDAGVHHYVAAGDAVEAAGNMLLVHAATDGYRTINFPQLLPRIFETAIWPSDNLLCNFCSALPNLPFNAGDTRAFRWGSAPVGNFELISAGPTLEGWAVDFDAADQPIYVHIYQGGPYAGGGTFLTGFLANAPRPDLTNAFGIPGNNGFHINVPCTSGQVLYAYAIDADLQTGGDGNSFIGAHVCP